MKHAATRDLYAYWDRLRGARPAPRRGEVDPTAIPRLLPDIALFELQDHGGIAVRLAGTRLCDLFARELRGAPATALWTEGSRGEIDQVLRDVMAEAGVAVIAAACRRDGRAAIPAEMVALPLADRTERRRFVIAALTLGGPAEARGGERIDALDAESARLSWPDSALGDRGFAALDMVAAAGDPRRIGRFIVYDGGRGAVGTATSR
ncbi:MAG TPA: PAS domain-containing protein [Hyphomicrobiales bacterium]|nr:PAS domain-containing protein [Hyphomicrobiales bacterium]